MTILRQVKLIIFDLDGTIIDSLEGAARSVNYVLKKYNFPSLNEAAISQYANNGIEYLIKSTSRCEDPVLVQKLVQDYEAYYSINYHTKCYDGVISTIDILKSMGKKLCVYTNKPKGIAQLQLEENELLWRMNYFLSDDGNTELKPNPKAVIDLMSRTGFDENQVMIVGDSDPDIQVGQRAGILTCYAAYGLGINNNLLKPDFRIYSPKDILKL